jgi:hypothetical protein
VLPTLPAVALAAIVLALALIFAVLVEVFEVMLLPRRVRRRWRGVRVFFRTGWRLWRALAEAVPRRWRGGLLSAFGPLSMVVLLTLWTSLLVTGFGVLQWAISQGGPAPRSLLGQLYFSGVTFFTLGYGDVTAASPLGKALSVVEAGVGFGFIAVVIGYLPVLYQLFSQREAHVIRLDARAGSPPTAAALLERHAGRQGLTALGALLADWEQWAAELLESHLSYPMLAYYRSQHDNESWLAALAAVADACALLVAGLEHVPDDDEGDAAEVPRFQARMTFAAARLTIVEMARVLADAPMEVPHAERAATGATRGGTADRLPEADRRALVARLGAVGLRFTADAAAGGAHGGAAPGDTPPALALARAAYEPQLVLLGARLGLALPPWLRAADAPDNWEQGAPAAREVYEAAERREVR